MAKISTPQPARWCSCATRRLSDAPGRPSTTRRSLRSEPPPSRSPGGSARGSPDPPLGRRGTPPQPTWSSSSSCLLAEMRAATRRSGKEPPIARRHRRPPTHQPPHCQAAIQNDGGWLAWLRGEPPAVVLGWSGVDRENECAPVCVDITRVGADPFGGRPDGAVRPRDGGGVIAPT